MKWQTMQTQINANRTIDLGIHCLLRTNCPNMFGKYSTQYTIDSRYLEFQGTHWNTSRYLYLDISELREENNKLNNHI